MSDRYRAILGMLIVVALLVLACTVALGHVEEKTSFGLTGILTIIGKVALDFSEWAFRGSRKSEEKEPKEEPKP